MVNPKQAKQTINTIDCDRQDATEYEKWISTSRKVIPYLLLNCPFDFGSRPCLGTKTDGEFTYITYDEMKEKVLAFASALIDENFSVADKLVIISENREEWVIADLGTMLAGGIVVPAYPTLMHEQIEFLVNHSEATIVAVSSQAQYDKVSKIIDNLNIHTIITMNPGIIVQQYPHTKSVSMTAFLADGTATLAKHKSVLDTRLERIEESDVCSIIYTSGTTGNPKGVMLTHRNFVSSAVHGIHIQYANQLRDNAIPSELSILPLSHVFARMIYFSLVIVSGGSIAFAENFNTIAGDLQKVKPNLLAGVPRIYETIYQKIQNKLKNSSALQRAIANWAVAIGKDVFVRRGNNQRIGIGLKLKYYIARKLVFEKLYPLFGGNLQALLSAGAKLRIDVAMFFCSIGLPLTEGYGLTETSPTITCSRPTSIRWGSVGKAVRSVEVNIADDGEILVKGDNVMKGYYRNEQATEEAFNEDGWFHTGDLGKLDADGYLEITGRKKDIMVMSNGENVAPAEIENILTSSPFIEQAVLVGDNRAFISALLVPNFAELKAYMQENNLLYTDHSSMVSHNKVQAFFKEQVRQVCQGKVAKFAQVRQFRLLDREFNIERNEVTPTLKIKRHVVHENFSQQIRDIYST